MYQLESNHVFIGFSVSGNGEHVCDDVNNEGTAVKWRSMKDTFSCVINGKN